MLFRHASHAPPGFSDLRKCPVEPDVVLDPRIAFYHACAGMSGELTTRSVRWSGMMRGFVGVGHPTLATLTFPCVWPQGVEIGLVKDSLDDSARGRVRPSGQERT